MKKILIFLFLLIITSCSPSVEALGTQNAGAWTQTPKVTYTPTIIPTPSATPIPWQKYSMTYLVKEGGNGKLWMPAPRNWEGIGMRNVQIIEIFPDPIEQYQDEQGNQIILWNRNGPKEYSIKFEVELSEIHYSIDPEMIGDYDSSSAEYKKYTSPSSRIESDDPRILELAKSIIVDEINPYNQANLIHQWVARRIDGQGEDGETALSTLEMMSGACGGHSFLYIALLRSLGIPARNIGGIHNGGGSTKFETGDSRDNSLRIHIWTEFYLPNYGWIQSDSSAGNKSFIGINGVRVVMFRGEDIELGHGYPLEIIPWFHMPQIDRIGNSDPKTQTIGEYLKLEVERFDG